MEAEFFAGNRRTLKKFQRKPLCITSLSTKRKLKEHEGLCINTNTLMSQPGAVFSLLLIGCVTLLTGCGSDSDSSPMMMANKNPAIPVNSGEVHHHAEFCCEVVQLPAQLNSNNNLLNNLLNESITEVSTQTALFISALNTTKAHINGGTQLNASQLVALNSTCLLYTSPSPRD